MGAKTEARAVRARPRARPKRFFQWKPSLGIGPIGPFLGDKIALPHPFGPVHQWKRAQVSGGPPDAVIGDDGEEGDQ